MPVGLDSASIAETFAIGMAGDDTGPAVIRAALGAPTSATVPQAWHSPQRPIQRTVVQPHSLQANGDLPAFDLVCPAAFTMTDNLSEAPDKIRQHPAIGRTTFQPAGDVHGRTPSARPALDQSADPADRRLSRPFLGDHRHLAGFARRLEVFRQRRVITRIPAQEGALPQQLARLRQPPCDDLGRAEVLQAARMSFPLVDLGIQMFSVLRVFAAARVALPSISPGRCQYVLLHKLMA
jgi:hypothetical protein